MNNHEWDTMYLGPRDEPKRKLRPPKGCKAIDNSHIKPKTYQYGYSNPKSQGAIIATTGQFDWFNPSTEEIHSAYSDRLSSWDRDRFEKLCRFIGTGNQGWAYTEWGQERLTKAAIIAFDLKVTPRAVRLVHWYNVSNGYSCPTIECIVPKHSPESGEQS